MNVELNEWRLADGLETVNLASLDDKDVAGLPLECVAVDRPDSLPFADELDFVVGMTMRTWTRTWFAMEEKYRNGGAALLSSDKLMRTAHKRQVLLTHVMHACSPFNGIG